MKTDIMLYNFETDKDFFKLSTGVRAWGILLMISKGSYQLSFPQSGHSQIVSPYEITYVPPYTEFHREIIEPIDFYQFAFRICDGDPVFDALHAGKLNVPTEQVHASVACANAISSISTNSEQSAEHLLHRILYDNYLFSHSTAKPQTSIEFLRVTDYISEHLSEQLSVSALAAILYLSPNGLIWKFKKELHITPMKYIAICRIQRAKQLLFDGRLTVGQIADCCGFANAYYFSNAFKKSEGISPSDFRKQCMK